MLTARTVPGSHAFLSKYLLQAPGSVDPALISSMSASVASVTGSICKQFPVTQQQTRQSVASLFDFYIVFGAVRSNARLSFHCAVKSTGHSLSCQKYRIKHHLHLKPCKPCSACRTHQSAPHGTVPESIEEKLPVTWESTAIEASESQSTEPRRQKDTAIASV